MATAFIGYDAKARALLARLPVQDASSNAAIARAQKKYGTNAAPTLEAVPGTV